MSKRKQWMGQLLQQAIDKLAGIKERWLEKDRQQELSNVEKEFLPAALEIVDTPPSPVGRATAWVLMSVFTIAILWALFGKVDEVAVARGKVIPAGYTKTIQAEDKGVVKKIHVKDGSKVNPGDVLIELDTTMTEADMVRLLKERSYYQVEIQRLLAEQSGSPFIPVPIPGGDPLDLQHQQQLYLTRQLEYKARVAVASQAVNQARVAIDIAEETKQKLAIQLELARDKEGRMRELVEQGAVSQFAYQDYKEKRITLQQDLAAQTREQVKNNHALLQSMETLNTVTGEWNRDVMTKLVEDRRQLQAIEEELKKAKEKHRLSTVTTPIGGTVQQLAVHTVGGVVTAAQVLMLVVPEGAAVEIEAWVENKDIGFVEGGQVAEIKVETFNFQKFGTLGGNLVEISTDAVEDKEKGLVYRALFRTDKDYFEFNGKQVPLSPGMAVTAEIKTRQKRIIEYFLDPFMKYRSEGLRER